MEVILGWVIVFPIIGIIVALAACGIAEDITCFFPVLVTLIVVGNVVTVGASALFSSEASYSIASNVSVCDVSKDMGLDPGKQYPVEVGARIGGSSGSGYFINGLFGGSGHINMQPASALSVGFDHGDKSAILELPIQQMTFTKDPQATTPQMTINLLCANTVHASQKKTEAPRHLVLNSGIFYFEQSVVEEGPVEVNPDVMRRGLSRLVAENLEIVDVSITPELYAKILG